MTGEPIAPGEDMENWSMVQSPVPPPINKQFVILLRNEWSKIKQTLSYSSSGICCIKQLCCQYMCCKIVPNPTNISTARTDIIGAWSGRGRCSAGLDNVRVVVCGRTSTSKTYCKGNTFIQNTSIYIEDHFQVG